MFDDQIKKIKSLNFDCVETLDNIFIDKSSGGSTGD